MTCPHCQASNPEQARFCATCGGALSSTGAGRASAQRPADGSSVSTEMTRTQAIPAPRVRTGEGMPFGSRYLLLERLGQGGMGEVWKARDLVLDQVIALKMIRAEFLDNSTFLERFKQEITLARRVTHRSVTRIYDLLEVEGTRCISMEYLEGVSLKEYVRREGALEEDKALRIMRDVCEGLAAAHDAGVVHRDLKPQNILIDPGGGAHIMDFGIALAGNSSGLTQTGAIIGSPEYMSPEQVRGEKVDARTDIYSLGLILFEMLTGELPFSADTTAAAMFKRLSEKPRRPTEIRHDLPPYLERAVLRCLEKERGFRYDGARELLADLEQRRHTTVGVSRYIAGARARKGTLAAAAAAAVISLLLSWLAWERFARPGPPEGSPRIPGVALLPFQDATGDPSMRSIRTALPALLESELSGAGDLRVIDGARTQHVLENLDIPLGREIAPPALRRVAGILGAEALITGEVRRAGGRLEVDARLFRASARDAEPLALAGVGEEGETAPFSIARKLGGSIAGALEVRIPQERAAREPATRSLEALLLYAEGLETVRSGDAAGAAVRLEQALARDPEFTPGHALLSEIYGRLGEEEKARLASGRALERLERVDARQAGLIRAQHALISGRNDEAAALYRELLEQDPAEPGVRFELAGILEETGDLAGAAMELEKCIAADPTDPSALYSLGRLRLRLGDGAEALRIFSDLLAIHTRASDDKGRGDVLLALGNVHFNSSKYGEALSYYQQSLEIRNRIQDRRGESVALANVANVLLIQGKLDEAERAARHSIELHSGLNDPTGLSKRWVSLGEIQQRASRIQEARKCFQQAMKIAAGLTDPDLVASISSNLGYVAAVLGDYAEANLLFSDALSKRRSVGEKRDVMRSLIDVGLIEQFMGRYAKAQEANKEAEALAAEIEEVSGAAVVSLNQGSIHDERGEYAAALEALSRGLEMARKVEDPNLIATGLVYLGGTLTRAGRGEEAEGLLAEAQRLIEETHDSELLPELLVARADLLAARGDRGSALRAADEAVRKATTTQNHRLILLARLAQARVGVAAGRPDSITALARIAADAAEDGLLPIRVNALGALAAAPAPGRGTPSAAAREAAGEAAKEGRSLGLRESLVAASLALARQEQGRGDSAAATRHYLDAAAAVREMAEGLQPRHRSSLLGRPELTALGEEAREYLSRHGDEAGRQTLAAAFSHELP